MWIIAWWTEVSHACTCSSYVITMCRPSNWHRIQIRETYVNIFSHVTQSKSFDAVYTARAGSRDDVCHRYYDTHSKSQLYNLLLVCNVWKSIPWAIPCKSFIVVRELSWILSNHTYIKQRELAGRLSITLQLSCAVDNEHFHQIDCRMRSCALFYMFPRSPYSTISHWLTVNVTFLLQVTACNR